MTDFFFVSGICSTSCCESNSCKTDYWHCLRSIRSRVFLLGMCLCVCPIRSPHIAATGLLLWAWRPENIDWLLHGHQSDSQQQLTLHCSMAHSSKCGQCHIVGWRMKLNKGLVVVVLTADLGLWSGTECPEWDDGLCSYEVVSGSWDYAQLDALQSNR